VLSSGVFVLLAAYATEAEFAAWGWRVPFLASATLVLVGLYVRLKLTETPEFRRAVEHDERVRVPMLTVFREHGGTLALATGATITTFLIFYLMTVFTLSWATTRLGFEREEFLLLQLVGVVFFAVGIPLSAAAADRLGRWTVLIAATIGIGAFGFRFEPLFSAGGAVESALFLSVGLGLMGLTYGPLGAALADLFPTSVRYTGASVAFNLAGILGGSLAPYIATALASKWGVAAVGYYLAAACAITLAALLGIRAGSSSAAGLAADLAASRS
jgi:MFS family permease